MTVYKYQGTDTEHYVGVPARDLTEEEFAALDEQQQFNVTEGKLYRAVGQPKGQRRQTEPEEPADEPADVADEQPAEPDQEG